MNALAGNDDIFGICESGPLLDFSTEIGAVVQSAVVIVAAFGGILEVSISGGR